MARLGLVARDVVDHASQTAPVKLVPEAGAGSYDLVLISVWATQLPAVIDDLRRLSGAPALLFFGNNPTGRAALPGDLPGIVHLGFPGIGGSMAGGAADYLRLPQQPTTLQTGGGHSVAQFEAVLHSRGFAVTRTPEMDGWLAVQGVPQNLRTLHLPVLRPVAVRYWSHDAVCFAANRSPRPPGDRSRRPPRSTTSG